jgi:hypothetical protein
MSQLAGAFRQVLKKATHPNVFIYNFQLEAAKEMYLVQGRLGDGANLPALELGAPEDVKDAVKGTVQETTGDREGVEGKSKVVSEVKEGRMEMERWMGRL